MIDNDYPCSCGHPRGCHAVEELNVFKFCGKPICKCNDYTPDNLRYLEMIIDGC